MVTGLVKGLNEGGLAGAWLYGESERVGLVAGLLYRDDSFDIGCLLSESLFTASAGHAYSLESDGLA